MAGKFGRITVSLSVSLAALLVFAGAGQCAPAPTAPKLVSVVAGRPFDAVPASGSPKVSLTVAPEETEPATFTVKYSKPLENVRVAIASDLTGPGKIERLNVKVYQVIDNNLVSSISQTSGAVFSETSLGPQPKQFWVTVAVPRRTPPGTYKGLIGIYYQNKTFDTIPIEVKVLPLRLIGSSKQYLLYTPYGPSAEGNESLMDADYDKFLAAFNALGVRSVSLNAGPSAACDAMAAYKNAGLASPMPIVTYAFDSLVPSSDDAALLQTTAKSSGIPTALFFTVDLPCQEKLAEVREQISAFKSVRAKVVARLDDEAAAAELEPELDGLVYGIDMQYPQSLINGSAKRTSSKWQWIWWDARESAKTNRLNAGVKLWRAGLDGAMPAWMPTAAGALDGTSSLLTEALREGIDDTRYLTSFMKALREVKDLKRAGDADYIATSEAYVNNFMAKPLDDLSIAQLADCRTKLVEYTLGLEKRVK